MFSGTPIEYLDKTITNDGFWPDVSVAQFQESRSIPPDLSNTTVVEALLAAIAEVNDSLESVKTRFMGKGIAHADQVPGPACDGVNQVVAQYKKAVFARAKADLLGEFASIGRQKSSPGQESDETRNNLLAEAAMVIRNLMGIPRVGVAII
ncbi:MAG: head completion/stabilization protein [Plesiomonas sp.]|uniref:Head completion/stabilization protein n=1 Tax=Plesiomonas shigelloides TaxID=703 RepID=A0A8I2B4S7_PLESH|nr:head completion/stabilization protein [Plesiomonas shigelloides]MBO1107893.1 head completion/stabilization protein [Plesiomonas shigelloides]